MVAEQTRSHPFRGPMVPSLFCFVARCWGAAGGAWSQGRSQNGLALAKGLRPELERRPRPHLKPTNKSWRVDETWVRVRGRWCYLYRTVDSMGGWAGILCTPNSHSARPTCVSRIDRSLMPMISATCHQVIFLAIARKITSCTFIA